MHDPLIGRRLANYRIDRLIGRGGMAQVYYGWDENLQRPVAVKVIDTRYRGDPTYARRFVLEARTVATWRHDNILQVYYAGEQDGLYYFAMEYVDGLDLGEILARYAAGGELMPYLEVARIGRAIAGALDYAHQRGVIHRDVKPTNVMVGRDGRVTLTDFGLALDVEQGTLGETFGSARYIAPEQARRSAGAVPQSDLYSMGIILFEMLTGSVPFDDPSPTTVALQHVTVEPPAPTDVNPDLEPAVDRILLKALRKSPQERYQTGRELVDDLERALGLGEMGPAPAPFIGLPAAIDEQEARRGDGLSGAPLERASSRPGPGKVRPWQVVVIGLASLLCLIVLSTGAILLWNQRDTDPPTDVAVPVESPASTKGLPLVATATPEVVAPTGMPSVTQSAAPTATASRPPPTASSTAAPTTTWSPTTQPTATVLYPDGRPLTLFYDAVGFYVWNPGESKIGVQPIAFESLDGTGAPAGNRFDGWRWSQYYPYLERGNCVRIEMLAAPSYSRPVQCRYYNAQVSTDDGSPLVFWVEGPTVTQFRVLWDSQEIGRCRIEAGMCEVYLP
jgi:serine/threonine protein kinase